MGGELSPEVIYSAVLKCSREVASHISFVLIGREKPEKNIPFEFVYASDIIELKEAPLYAIRKKKKSSMGVGVNLLKEGQIQALISTGNTGALVSLATLHLPLLPTIEKPALLAVLPKEGGSLAVLDVGAHVNCNSSHVLNYAKLGVLYQQYFNDIKVPKIGLLNIGSERVKGTQEVKEAYRQLEEHFADQFLGNVEGCEVFQGEANVIVTDGFTGNVFLKTCEGTSTFLFGYLEKYFSEDKLENRDFFNHFQAKFDYAQQPGAFLCGIDGIVVKCHSYSNTQALISGIKGTIALLEKNVIGKMKEKLNVDN